VLNLAIVGCGMVANEHLGALRKVKEIKVVALCDKDEETAERMSRKWNVRTCYTDYCKMLDEEELSIVSVLTPPQSHVPVAIEAIRRDVNVLIEKPLTLSIADANRLLEVHAASRAKVTVDHLALFSKVMIKVTNLIESGAIGDILGSRIQWLLTPDDSMASTEKHWCHKLPGGRFGEVLPHPVYLIQAVIDEKLSVDRVLTEKRGKYPWMRNDELRVVLRGKSGHWADIYASFNAPRKAIILDVYGTRRILRIDIINQTLIEFGKRSISKVASAKDVLGQSTNLFLSTIENTIDFLRAKEMEHPLRNLYTCFLRSIENGVDPTVTPQMAFETVRVTEEICNMIQLS